MSSTRTSLSNKNKHRLTWSDLPKDLLESISINLPFSDHCSLKWVCSSWRAATKGINIPLLVFFSKSISNNNEHPKNDAKLLLFGVDEGKPCIRNKDRGGTIRLNPSDNVVGAHPEGWLFLTDKNGHYFLIELLTLVRIDLPKIKFNHRASQHTRPIKIILSDNPNCCGDFIVIILYVDKFERKLAFWMNGETKWSFLGGHDTRCYSDILWFNDSLYAVIFSPLSVEVINFNRNDICSSGSSTKKFRIINNDPINYWSLDVEMTKLVVSCTGEILVVAYREEWGVFKVDLSKNQCVKLNTLNGQALIMVGIEKKRYGRSSWPDNIMADDESNNLFCISSADVGKYGYKANSIYFSKVGSSNDDTYDRKIALWNYSFEDGQVEDHLESMLPFEVDVELQPLGLFSLNNSKCGRWSRRDGSS